MKVSHAAAAVDVGFDDSNLIADAGLVPVLALAGQIGLPELVAERVVITGAANGAGANPVAKVMSLVAGMVAGADSIEDMDRLRHAGNGVVFDQIRAPSTLGTFLRALTHGHVQQLNAVLRQSLIALAERTPLLPGAEEVVFVDLDSTHRQVYGYAKQGAASVDHDLMVQAVEANTDQKWVVLYVKRWLKAQICMPDGTVVERDRGTPQGSAVSPVLANLFMHYAFDFWLEREFPAVEFERFADDAVVHCATERQAREVWAALSERMESVGLRLHPDKTKLVYCKDRKRWRDYACTSFTFLGYTFRARKAPTIDQKSMFSAFLPAISGDALKDKGRTIRRWRIHLRTTSDLGELARWMNPIIRGWMNYYGKFYRTEMFALLRRINTYLVRWARRKFKRLRAFKRAKSWWNGLMKREPALFVHWAWMPEF